MNWDAIGAVGEIVGPFLAKPHELLADILAPLRLPRHPIGMARFGMRAVFSASPR